MNISRKLFVPIIRNRLHKPSSSRRNVGSIFCRQLFVLFQFLLGAAAVGTTGTVVYVKSLDSIEDITEMGIIRLGRAVSAVSRND